MREKKRHQSNLELITIEPLTKNQEKVFDNFDKNLLLTGSAGTGKSFLAVGLSLQEILVERTHKRLVIIRSAVASRDIGFLPGNETEKMEVFEEPYYAICNELLNRGDGYDILKQKGLVEFTSTSFLRGLTLRDSIILVDEIQNASYQELATVITRVGENSKIIFCGDTKQTDLSGRELMGIFRFEKVIKTMASFSIVDFTIDDIVRSSLVKEFLIAETKVP